MSTSGVLVHERRRFRAPAQDRGVFCDPPSAALPSIVAANQARLAESTLELQGRRLVDLARNARADLLQAAYEQTARYRSVGKRPAADSALFVAGHQAEMFHPGVWAKHFFLDRFAKEWSASHGPATAVNLVIDSDTWKSTSLSAPGGSRTAPTRAAVAFDSDGGQANIPTEERPVVDAELWRSFGQRLAQHLAPLVADPLIRDAWPRVMERWQAGERPGAAVAQARHQIEGAWGLDTLELPISATCRFESFHWFVAHLAAQWPVWRGVYNQSVHEYRKTNRIRSRNHPVPDLALDGDWHEMPLWIWTAEDPRRRRLFVRQAKGTCTLTDRTGWTLDLPLSPDGDASGAVQVLAHAAATGIKIRTRALTTTLWARLFLGDLFVHGIGGAKYDQLTDMLIHRFFGIEPPGYAALSATLFLPVDRPGVSPEDLRRIDGQLRELVYHPERWLDPASLSDEERAAATVWIENKQRWVATEATIQNARQRTREIRAANAALQPWVERSRVMLRQERDETGREWQRESLLASREYSIFLYPEKILRDFLLAFRPATL